MVKHRKPRQPYQLLLGRVLLSVLFGFVALYAGTKCFLREPEVASDPNTENISADALAEEGLSAEELAAEEARRSHLERKDGYFTILLAGVDDGNGGSDTNILVSVDTVGKTIFGASIPRDTKALVEAI